MQIKGNAFKTLKPQWELGKNDIVLYKAKLLQLKLIHIFARAILLMKKLEIEKTKPTFIISVLKVEYQVALVSSIFNFFISNFINNFNLFDH